MSNPLQDQLNQVAASTEAAAVNAQAAQPMTQEVGETQQAVNTQRFQWLKHQQLLNLQWHFRWTQQKFKLVVL